ncbi:hypothetical protein ACIA5D_48810 [Actinoplanes sp. NPDC051513]|uniref:hypothetical protein n=1 Tax=Actinoplanes sp. NPDC051513 TaxID=3363908 RepID=UPI0037B371BF
MAGSAPAPSAVGTAGPARPDEVGLSVPGFAAARPITGGPSWGRTTMYSAARTSPLGSGTSSASATARSPSMGSSGA